MANTINDPLIITDSYEHPYPAGEYVDKSLAEEMVTELEKCLKLMLKVGISVENADQYDLLQKLILKAKG